jgi:hypothetical protein
MAADLQVFGGRYWDRTSDPLGVNERCQPPSGALPVLPCDVSETVPVGPGARRPGLLLVRFSGPPRPNPACRLRGDTRRSSVSRPRGFTVARDPSDLLERALARCARSSGALAVMVASWTSSSPSTTRADTPRATRYYAR